MFGKALRAAGGGVLAAVVCASLFLSVAAQAEEGGNQPPSSLAIFDELYARLTTDPEGSRQPPEVSEPAEELRFALRRELIRSDAEIEILKLEAARFTGERQEEALNRLVSAAAARERSVWRAIRQLERLAEEPPAAMPVAEPAAEEEAARGGLGISFEPKNVLEDPDP